MGPVTVYQKEPTEQFPVILYMFLKLFVQMKIDIKIYIKKFLPSFVYKTTQECFPHKLTLLNFSLLSANI